jgi:hypothetical protein
MRLSWRDAIWLLALAFVALCLVPAGAHFFELPNKLRLPTDQYMTVQQIYAGWAWFGLAVLGALIFTALHAVLARTDAPAFRCALSAFLYMAVSQAIFWGFTFPINRASANWTRLPDNFEAARRQWEYAHAAGAVMTFAALIALGLCAVVRTRQE